MKKEYSPSTLHPSRDNVFKSFFCIEDKFSDATLKVDYDNGRNPFDIRKVIRVLKTIKDKFCIMELMVFKTGKGHHLRIWIARNDAKVIGAKSILNLQSKLGDDPKRQKFNAARVRRREPYWNVLWRMKVRNGIVVSKEEFVSESSRKIILEVLDY
jgi:hypothetical protein